MTATPRRLASRVDAIQPSLTLSVDDRVRTLIAEGKPVINLSVGQPDFDTPGYIAEAAVRAIAEGFTRYTSPIGTIELRKAAAAWFREKTGVDYEPKQILVSCGSKHALHNALQAVVSEGDEVLVPAPYWVSYPDLVRMAGGVPVHPASTFASGYRITAAALEAAITPRTRAVILNSPNNPSGAVFSEREARDVARVIEEHDLFLISDEIYDQIVYAGVKPVPFASIGGMRERTVTVNGVSKAYAMTGWRIGFAAGPAAVIEAMGRYQAQATGNPCSISQKAALAAISRTAPELETMRQTYEKRRQIVMQALEAVPFVEWNAPQGAFYFLLRVAGAFGRKFDGRPVGSAEEVASILLERGLALVPGTGFGAPDCLRLSFAASDDQLRRGLEILGSTFLLLGD